MDTALSIIVVRDLDGRRLLVNKEYERRTGVRVEQAIGGTPYDIHSPEGAARILNDDQQVLESHKSLIVEKTVLLKGKAYTLRTTMVPLYNKEGEPYAVCAQAVDITEHKQAEEQIQASLKEKETLLRELYHRTKNNMQIVSSLLTMQSSSIKDEKVLEIFKDIQNRIGTMSLVHQKLYQSKDLSNIELGSYIEDLMNTLTSSYQDSTERVRMKLDLERVSLPIEAAIHCGLILNEMISNSFVACLSGRQYWRDQRSPSCRAKR